MTTDRNGKVVTFYSFKGGTGRTMALANVAWILAAAGKRVLVADWDLESPGLYRYFEPFIPPGALSSTTGIIGLIREFEDIAADHHQRDDTWYRRHASVEPYVFQLSWDGFPVGGSIDFLHAGEQNNDYGVTLSGLDWDNFYETLGGKFFFTAMRNQLQENYDFTLIDSRTGYSDVADICTIQMPDILVDCFTLSHQAMDGAARIAGTLTNRYSNIRILPVAMRLDSAERDRAEARLTMAKQLFAGLPAGLEGKQRDAYWASMQVPYQAYYSYEESLATFVDEPGTRGSLLSAYESLTAQITKGDVSKLDPIDPAARERVKARFTQSEWPGEEKVQLQYAPGAQVWAEWVRSVLGAAGVEVYDPWLAPGTQAPAGVRTLVIASKANSSSERQTYVSTDQNHNDALVLYVDEPDVSGRLPARQSAIIAGMAEDAAIDRLLDLIGHRNARVKVDEAVRGRPRFPGLPPVIFNAPGENARFTGRESDLRELRVQLNAGNKVAVSGRQKVALQGMGGIGKTQLALAYVHRFASAYDVVWWIAAEHVAFIDSQMEDLLIQLNIPSMAPGPGMVRALRQALQQGNPYRRWLLVFDNALDPDRVKDFIPSGTGHVIVTSRDISWGTIMPSLTVDVFERQESVDLLRLRIPAIRPSEAGDVARLLGDLPIAVAAAAALLSETGLPIESYLEQLAEHGARGLTAEDGAAVPEPNTQLEARINRSVEATWDLSLDLLKDRSPAAYRLLQLCSVMASEISLKLVYSDELADALKLLDPAVAETLVRGSLVQHINRLALLKLDSQAGRRDTTERASGGQIIVHRLLQHVVRNRMSPDERMTARHEVHKVLAASRPEGEVDDPALWPEFRVLWPHLEISNAVACGDEAVRRLLIDRVRYLYIRRDLRRGLDRAQQTDASWTARLADLSAGTETHPDGQAGIDALQRQLLHLRFNMANILRELGRFNDSYELDKTVLSAQQELLGANHPHTLMTAGGLAADLRGRGQYADALAHDVETYQLWKDNYGDESPRTLAALNNLATSYRLMGDYQSALSHDISAHEGRSRALGERDPNTLASAGHIGRDMREAGDYQQATAMLEGIAKILKELPAASPRDAQNAKANWAVSLRSAGQAEAASSLLKEAYAQLSADLPSSPDTLACRLSLAVNFLATLELARAEEELTAVHEAYRKSLGAEHPHTLVCVNNLAMIARANEDFVKARSLASEAGRDLGRVLGPAHPYTLAAQTNAAICEAEAGHLTAGLEIIDTVVPALETVLGLEHPDTLRGVANQALLHVRLGHDNADRQLRVAIGRLADRVGPDHPAPVALAAGRFAHRIVDPHPF